MGKGWQTEGQSARTCVMSSLGVTQVSPPAVKLQNTRKASREQPWLGSTQYSPIGRNTGRSGPRSQMLLHLCAPFPPLPKAPTHSPVTSPALPQFTYHPASHPSLWLVPAAPVLVLGSPVGGV